MGSWVLTGWTPRCVRAALLPCVVLDSQGLQQYVPAGASPPAPGAGAVRPRGPGAVRGAPGA
eukprot:7817956-Pyramimonas_sp.AAC.1